MEDRREKAREYADEQARKLVRNETSTKARILMLYFGGVFFTVVSIWRVVMNPGDWNSYTGFVFVFVCVIAILTLRKRVQHGLELLLREGELRIPQDDDDRESDEPSGESQK